MHSMQWYDWVRIATVILSVLSIFRVWAQTRKLWNDYAAYFKELVLALIGCLAFIVVNSIERIVDDNEVHIGFFLGFTIAAYSFTATTQIPRLFRSKDSEQPPKV